MLGACTRLLDPFASAHQLGFVFHPQAVIRFQGSEVQPDIMVLPEHPHPSGGWDLAPTARLVAEVISPTSGHRDREQKRSLYMDAGVPEYWIIDGERRMITVVKPGEADRAERERVSWAPVGAGATLLIELPDVVGA